MKDLFNQIDLQRAISPAAATTDDTAWVSEIIDRQGFESVTFAIALGALADADATFVALLEDGDESDLSDNAAVADTEMLGTEALAGFTFAADNALRKIGYRGPKRYCRLTITPSNNSGDAFCAVVAIMGHPDAAPTDNPPV